MQKYISGSNSTALTFRYTVASGDNDTDGIAVTSPIDLNSGTIKNTAGDTNAELTFTVPTTTGVKVDTTAPAPPSMPDMAAYSDRGDSDSDNITYVDVPEFVGTAESGTTVKLYDGATEIGSATATGGNWSIIPPGALALSDGEHTITAKAFNSLGNGSVASPALTITIDTAEPNAPTITSVSNDTGLSSSDGITNDSTIIINGTAEANSDIAIVINNSMLPAVTTDASGSWSFDFTHATLTEGTYSITAIAQDKAGNQSAVSAGFNVKIDTTPPTVSGVSDGQTYTTAVSPTFSDTNGAAAELQKGTDTAAAYTSGTEISVNGSYTLTVTDTAGNVTTRSFTVAIPSAPTGVSVISGNDQADVSWTAPSDNGGSAVTGYVVKYRIAHIGEPFIKIQITDPSTTSYVITGLSNGAAYEFCVAAKNTIGTGNYSATQTVLIGRTGKAIVSTSIGSLSGGNIVNVPSGTTVSALKAGITVSDGAHFQIITGAGGSPVADESTSVTSAMKVEVTPEIGISAEYSISFRIMQ